MKKQIISLAAISVLIFALIAGCSNIDGSKEQEETIKIPVETISVSRKTITKEVTYMGDIRAEQDVKVFSKIPDRIISFEKDEGDYVQKGEVIARIEATKIEQAVVQARAAVASAKSQLANLQAEFQRAQRLIKENAISQQQFDAIKTQYQAAQAMVEQGEAALIQAQSQRADANVTAPISGIIGVRYYEQGDMATGPLPLVTVVQMKRVKAVVNAPEQDFGELKVGQCADLKVMSYPDRLFEGKITRISPVLDPITRMGKIEIIIDNSDGLLKPGMFAEVRICIRTLEDVLAIPKHAILESTELSRVNGLDVAVKKSQLFVEKDGLARLRDVEVGYSNGTVSVVTAGLTDGENIVIVGQQSLKDSVEVKVLN